MPRKIKNIRKHKGGSCAPQLDITRYTKPCASGNEMPLDNIFNKHFSQSGGCAGMCPMTGGGFSIMPEHNVGNLPEIRGYSDCCPPVFTKNGAQWSNNFQPLCGQAGGKSKKRSSKHKKSKRSTKHKKYRSSKKRSYSKNNKSKSKSKSKRKSKSKSKRKSKGKKHKGGGVKGMSDVNSNFSANMANREFGCSQPYWKPNCI